uniref:Uncharacterized protein n=1 Tax=Triticum urartu TaxID=4572 RepID=A0A8R7UIN6_TRIUA
DHSPSSCHASWLIKLEVHNALMSNCRNAELFWPESAASGKKKASDNESFRWSLRTILARFQGKSRA